jgi:hypothetical protein
MGKFKSFKFWFALVSLALSAYIVVKNLTAFNNVAIALVTPALAYMYANVKQDEIYLKHGSKDE